MNRMSSEMINGARVWIAKLGTTSGDNTITADTLPDAPTAEKQGPWLKMGRIANFKAARTSNDSTLTATHDDGMYHDIKLKRITARTFQFSSYDMIPEAFRLAFGLAADIVDGTDQAIGGSSTDTIRCWMYFEITDSYRGGNTLLTGACLVDLSLANDVEFKSDPTQVDYSAEMIFNKLETLDPTAVTA